MNHFILTQLSKCLAALLALDPASKDRVHALHGKIIRIELRPFHLQFECRFNESGITIHQDNTLTPDVTLRGTPMQLMGAMIEKSNRHHFFADDLVIEGNAMIAQHVTALFDQLDIDWQDHASKIFGDATTHHASQAIQRFTSWLNTSNHHLSEDLNHYLHDEKNWFPAREVLQDFFTEVDHTRMAIDRAEARIKHLSQLLKNETKS